jgi:hypothetical protein
LGKSVANEVVANVCAAKVHARIGRFGFVALTGEMERSLRHLRFVTVGPAGNKRDALAIELARFKVHLLKCFCRVLAEERVEDDEWLNEIDPVRVADGLQAFDVSQQ